MNMAKEITGAIRLPVEMVQLRILLLVTGLLPVLLAGCTLPLEEADSPVPTPSAPADPVTQDATNPYFVLDHVLDIAIEIAPADWDALRHQTRTWEELGEEIATGCLAQPFADIYSWFSAQVTVDGETHADVGVRKKGFIGSLNTDKPSLKLRFDKYVDGQFLGGAMERMTLNNSIQDASLINTCLAYQIFADAGLPAPRCNFATVKVNDQHLGLYVHVEEIKPPFLARHFAHAQGNLYEGTVSDFRPGWRGTLEKKTNEDANDWSDIDAVVAALQDPTPAGLAALDAIVDRDRFLSFWATEVLVGHWDGYVGNRNNFHLYREPDAPFVFIPWGVDQVFSLEEDPNPLDSISQPPLSVMAHGAIAHRLYQDDAGRTAYIARLQELLDTVWNETALLESTNAMAAIVQQYTLPHERAAAAADTERVRQFIQERRGEILKELEPGPPDWPWPLSPAPCQDGQPTGQPQTWEETLGALDAMGNQNGVFDREDYDMAIAAGIDEMPPWEEILILDTNGDGAIDRNEYENAVFGHQPAGQPQTWEETLGALDAMGNQNGVFDREDYDIAIAAGIDEMPPWEEILALDTSGDGTIDRSEYENAVFWDQPADPPQAWAETLGALDAMGNQNGVFDREDYDIAIAAGIDELPSWEDLLFLDANGDGAIDRNEYESVVLPDAGSEGGAGADEEAPADMGLVINEVAAKGDPLDWFELYNSTDASIALTDFVLADDLTDPDKRVSFPADMVLAPGAYLQIQLDKDGWPGFALGSDEELGIWTVAGTLVAQVDWAEDQAGEGMSFARVPDVTGDFQTVDNPTPGAPN